MRDESLKPDTVSFAMTIIPRNPVAVILASLGLIGMIALAVDIQAKQSRYRPMPGHPFLEDRETGLYPHAHCELRVPIARNLPDPITRSERDALMALVLVMRPAGLFGRA